jgi:hypothetical protein
MTHIKLCDEILAAVRVVAERNGLHVEQSGEAVNQLVSATARVSLAIAQAADRKATAVAASQDVDGKIGVTVLSEGDFLDVVCM